ncbi:hypothetical protein HHK36_026791 [Tetracentron sinense]|uniref:NB-ARC domain-containing protein n=1 Tax=Tetracentron sinense TaxID=13715 RepID=A0A834YKB0_TETSI|nr:hypothetical protein HHK36_026791 [Tetracentron sinense]
MDLMDSVFKNVWKCLIEEDQVRIIRAHDMKSVGKMTLLKEINNKFLHGGTQDFDLVIWVEGCRITNVEKVQKNILLRLRLELSQDEHQDTSTVGDVTLNSHNQIPELVARVALKCEGLPLALVTIGETMAARTAPHEWNNAVKLLRKFVLKKEEAISVGPWGGEGGTHWSHSAKGKITQITITDGEGIVSINFKTHDEGEIRFALGKNKLNPHLVVVFNLPRILILLRRR